MDKNYYAWVPLLTGKINFDYSIEQLDDNWSIVDEKERNHINKELSISKQKYYIRSTSDNTKKYNAVISIDKDNKIDAVFMLRKGKEFNYNNLGAYAKCKIEENGLIEITVKEPENKKYSLFKWDDIQKKKIKLQSSNEEFQSTLAKCLKENEIKWIKEAYIQKNKDEKSISIYKDKTIETDKIKITLSADKNTAILNLPNHKTIHLKTIMIKDKKYVYFISITEKIHSIAQANAIYRVVRDIYHNHTHHKNEEHQLLQVIPTKDECEAISKLITQFEKLIILEHKTINEFVIHEKNKSKFIDSRYLIIRAKGVMIYASSFLNLVKNIEKKDYEHYSFVFQNAFRSINTLVKDIELSYTNKSNIIIRQLTIIMTVLCLITLIITSINIAHTMYKFDTFKYILDLFVPKEPNSRPLIFDIAEMKIQAVRRVLF